MVYEVKSLDETELLGLYAALLREMRERRMIRTANAIPGDLGERFVKGTLGLKLAPNSIKGYDATDGNGMKYQIKTRRITPTNPSRQLGGFRDISSRLFDYCIVVILQEDFRPTELSRTLRSHCEIRQGYDKRVQASRVLWFYSPRIRKAVT